MGVVDHLGIHNFFFQYLKLVNNNLQFFCSSEIWHHTVTLTTTNWATTLGQSRDQLIRELLYNLLKSETEKCQSCKLEPGLSQQIYVHIMSTYILCEQWRADNMHIYMLQSWLVTGQFPAKMSFGWTLCPGSTGIILKL